jgi:MoaA/NifB/PqqE/SkfB family radical SAM enzyme
MADISSTKQEILKGSSRLYSRNDNPFDRVRYMIDNMHLNKAYLSLSKNTQNKEQLLSKLKKDYKIYRERWVNVHENYKNDQNFSSGNKLLSPLSIDIETAAICDLACPHCSREYIITPDKIMKFELYKKIVDECVKLEVPSIKLNWRGEPLLNPKIDEFIKYAKEKGILEVSINTNAATLSEEKSKKLINSNLDIIIFSFDGGRKETYEKMRPGRFHNNNFDKVYENIKKFSEIKKKMNSKFPVTKIQMILTKDSRGETQDFFDLFSDILDDVTITQYNERGGSIKDLTETQQNKIEKYLGVNKLKKSIPYMVNFDDEIFISKKRKSCEQIFQRLMLTYNGRVGMCCHDWGAQHGVGFISEDPYKNDHREFLDVKEKIEKNKKGFSLLKNAKMPEKYNEPLKKVDSLENIWNGDELTKVRKIHRQNKLDDLDVCKNCTFKDTFTWEKIN